MNIENISTQGNEFVEISAIPGWTSKNVQPPGGLENIFYRDSRGKTYCRFLELPRGFKGGRDPLKHDCDEIVFIVSGTLVNTITGKEYGTGSIAVFPAGTQHGPLAAPEGATTLEFRHYSEG